VIPVNEIVVGVDGSKGAQRALEWALQEARLRSAPMRVVYAPQMMEIPTYVAGRAGGYAGPTRAQVREAAERMLDEAMRAAGAREPDGAIAREVVLGEHPAAALLRAAKGADLLVVGSRGLGGFRGLIVGSVSLHCVTHASCPVTVVPAAGD
jgi:nucleotide-binding universal stress UspA family protein